MSTGNEELELAAILPAAELARLRRRVAFLEAALIQVLRDEGGLREWFTAAELAALRLPGIPASRGGIARVAREQGWDCRPERVQGGNRLLYHYATLPRRAFAAFIDRVLRGEADGGDHGGTAAGPAPALGTGFPPVAAPPAVPVADNATPAWVLPLLRLLRSGNRPLDCALAELPGHLSPATPCPSFDEAVAVLSRIGTFVR